MSNYNSLKTTIDANIKQNGRQEITGQILNSVLNQMVNILGTGYQFAGVATTATNPGSPDAKVFYIANGKGTYTNFGGLEVTEDEVVVLYWDSSWHKVSTGIASQEKLTELESEMKDTYGDYVENPEWVKVVIDKDGKIIYGIKTDGKFYFGDGCPPQVKDYIEEKISSLSLDEYEDIVAFLNDYLGSDTTLKVMIDGINATKVNKEEGKSLIDSEYASTKYSIDNTEFLELTLDTEDKILEGIQNCGTKVIGGDLNVGGSTSINGDTKILGNMEVSGVSYKVIESSEYLAAWVDAEDKVIFGFKTDGKTYIGDADFLNELDIDALSSIMAIENPEYIEAKTDSECKLLAGRTLDGVAFENVGFSTPKVFIGSHTIENIEDIEGRSEITTDNEGKIMSYRDGDGVLHENVGIETGTIKADNIAVNSMTLPENSLEQSYQYNKNHIAEKNWYLPKFGKVNIKSETFYLTADPRWSTNDDVVCIQMYDDTDANAAQRLTLSYYYIKSTLTPLASGGYDRTSVNENSVKLQLFPAKDIIENNGQYFVKKITKVNGEYYLTSSLVENNGVYNICYIYDQANSMKVNYTDDNPDQTTLTNAIEVGKIVDVPPVKAWFISKALEHYCIADIDFGDFYSKNNVAVGIKYQGSSTTAYRKKGFRLTFYKNATYAKKEKVKIGEMVRLSGFNMKAFSEDRTRVKDPIISNIFIEIWETRGKDAYPWNTNNCIYNGATGFIKSFPIELDFNSQFYGLYFFGLKKDEKNYMLDGTDESGIFVSGSNDNISVCFDNASHLDCEDEMMDEMSQSTADALDEFFKYCKGFVDGNIEIEGQTVNFTNDMLEERIDINNWIDYWIGLELFTLRDNAFHNAIIYSGKDKKKFSLFFYDLDISITYYPYNSSYVSIMDDRNMNIAFWKKLLSEYKDCILNRYVELRKSVLNVNNFKAIYQSYTEQIPENVISAETTKWGVSSVHSFKDVIDILNQRLEYLDKTEFNLNIN